MQAAAPDDPHRRADDHPEIDEVQLDYLTLGGLATDQDLEEAMHGDILVWISRSDVPIPPDMMLPSGADAMAEAAGASAASSRGGPEIRFHEVVLSVLNLVHRQSDAVQPILGPKGDHPYMVSAAAVTLQAWGLGECILKSDQEPAIGKLVEEVAR